GGRPFTALLVGESGQLAAVLEPSRRWRAASEARGPRRKVEVREGCAPDDPVIRNVGLALYGELGSEGLGGRLYAESLANVLAVHLLRHYTASRNAPQFNGGLAGQTLRRVLAYVADNYEGD